MKCWVSLTSPLLGSKQVCPKQVCQNAHVSIYLPLNTWLGAEKEETGVTGQGPAPAAPSWSVRSVERDAYMVKHDT